MVNNRNSSLDDLKKSIEIGRQKAHQALIALLKNKKYISRYL